MKKKIGYTLAEVLIALGIVGFISAIMLPMINKVKPDPTKVTYIKTFDAIMAATHEIAGNTSVYPMHEKDVDPQWDYKKCPLFNTKQVKVNGVTYPADASKFCMLLGTSINTVDTTFNCKTTPIMYNESVFNNPSFTGVNGVQYVVSTDKTATKYRTDIYIDVNGDEGKNCMYVDGGTCKNPDRFKLSIAANGLIVPQDKVGAKYLEERKDWTKRSVGKSTELPDIAKVVDKLEPDYIGPEQQPEPNPPGPGTGIECLRYWTEFIGCKKPTVTVASKDLPGKMNWYEAKAACEAEGLRLPLLNELISINKAASTGLLDGFTFGTEYWTSQTQGINPNNAQNVMMLSSFTGKGMKGAEPKTTRRKARCVE